MAVLQGRSPRVHTGPPVAQPGPSPAELTPTPGPARQSTPPSPPLRPAKWARVLRLANPAVTHTEGALLILSVWRTMRLGSRRLRLPDAPPTVPSATHAARPPGARSEGCGPSAACAALTSVYQSEEVASAYKQSSPAVPCTCQPQMSTIKKTLPSTTSRRRTTPSRGKSSPSTTRWVPDRLAAEWA